MTLAQATFSESQRVETEPDQQVFAFVLLCHTVFTKVTAYSNISYFHTFILALYLH